MSTFVISKRSNDQYKFVFTSRNGNVIFTSLSYDLKFECEMIIDMIKKSEKELVLIKKKSISGKFYFEVLFNNKIYGTSRKYSTLLLLEKGIVGIKNYLQSAEVLDFSNQEHLFW